jgi:hypothetical protein
MRPRPGAVPEPNELRRRDDHWTDRCRPAFRDPLDQVVRCGDVGGEVQEVEVPDIAAAVRALEPVIRPEFDGEPIHEGVPGRVDRNGAGHHCAGSQGQAGDAKTGRPHRSAVHGSLVPPHGCVVGRDGSTVSLQCTDRQVGRSGLAGLPVAWAGQCGGLRGQGVEGLGDVAVGRRTQYDADGPAASLDGEVVPLVGAARDQGCRGREQMVELGGPNGFPPSGCGVRRSPGTDGCQVWTGAGRYVRVVRDGSRGEGVG